MLIAGDFPIQIGWTSQASKERRSFEKGELCNLILRNLAKYRLLHNCVSGATGLDRFLGMSKNPVAQKMVSRRIWYCIANLLIKCFKEFITCTYAEDRLFHHHESPTNHWLIMPTRKFGVHVDHISGALLVRFSFLCGDPGDRVCRFVGLLRWFWNALALENRSLGASKMFLKFFLTCCETSTFWRIVPDKKKGLRSLFFFGNFWSTCVNDRHI